MLALKCEKFSLIANTFDKSRVLPDKTLKSCSGSTPICYYYVIISLCVHFMIVRKRIYDGIKSGWQSNLISIFHQFYGINEMAYA